jgi:phage/plasmid-associated DNA primase
VTLIEKNRYDGTFDSPEYDYIAENREGIVDNLRKQGVNLKGIRMNQGKRQDDGWKKWQTETCDEELPIEDNFMVIGGKISNGLVVFDCDFQDFKIIEKLFPNILNQTLVIQTGNGYHIYLFLDKPCTNFKLKKDGKIIETKAEGGYVIGPSSKHFDKDENSQYYLSGKVYKIISNVTTIKSESYDNIFSRLGRNGWKGSGIKDFGNVTIEDLLKGDWSPGERHDNIFYLSLYLSHAEFTKEKILEINTKLNQTCNLPTTESEVERAVNEGIYQYEINQKTSDSKITLHLNLKGAWYNHKNSSIESREKYQVTINELEKKLDYDESKWIKKTSEFEKAYSLLQELDRKEALAEFLKTFKDKKDTELKITFKQAEKKLKREYEKNQSQNNEKAFTNENFDLVADIIQNENHVLTIRETKEMWIYDEREGVYRPLGDTFIAEECQKLIFKCNRKTVGEVVDTIRRNQTMIDERLLLDSREINTQNGILDPNTFERKDHSPEYLTTTKLPFSVDFEARNFKLWRHILTIIDPKDINLIMELIWICISWNNPFKKMFVFKGITNTQKSTLADILIWIIGNSNVSREKPMSFLSKDSRFGTSKFIGKRMNIASEIGSLDSDMLENQKSLVGAELQNTERKNDNTERYFDPTRFVFLYTTNKLGSIYSSINDNSVITRFQFLIFRNQIDDEKTNGQWYDSFFDSEDDKQSAINTVVRLVIAYKKSQVFGSTPKTKWSSIAETKMILREQMPKEDKYFEDERIIEKNGSKLTLQEIKKDFESFTGNKFKPQVMGFILKRQGFKSKQSNSVTYYHNVSFNTKKDQTTFDELQQ